MRAQGLRTVALVGLIGVLTQCAGAVVHPKDGAPAASEPLAHEAPEKPAGLVFPPPPDHARKRPPLPQELRAAAERELVMVKPELDASKRVTMRGKEVRFEFNQPIRGASANAPAGGLVKVDPNVTGLATWQSETVLVFTAARYLDPKGSYRISLGAVESVSGKHLDPFDAELVSTTGAMIAGKEIGHAPEAGKERVVAMDPAAGEEVAPAPVLRVLFDQPISLPIAKSSLRVEEEGGRPVSIALRHATSDQWNGTKIDRKYIVEITPLRTLAAGKSYTLVAREHDGGEERQAFTVAKPFLVTDIDCGWSRSSAELCESTDGLLKTDQREIHVRLTNRVHDSSTDLRKLVHITPFVRNVSVDSYGWDDGRLVVRADFQPSTRYHVQIGALVDRFGQRLDKPIAVTVAQAPLGASVSMPEGLMMLDEEQTRHFAITSRNVSEAELSFWRVDDNDVPAFRKALDSATGDRALGDDAPHGRLEVKIRAQRDQLVETKVDLRSVLGTGSWLASVRPKTLAFEAQATQFPRGSSAARPPVALLKAGNADSLAVHTHSVPGATVVQVARLAGGQPVSGASVAVVGVAGFDQTFASDADGVAVLPIDTREKDSAFVRVTMGQEQLLVPLSRQGTSAGELAPELRGGVESASRERAVLITDRGIYRPGSTIAIKATVFAPDGSGLKPLAGSPLIVRVKSATDRAACHLDVSANDAGSAATECKLAADAETGLYRISVSEAGEGKPTIAETMVRVAAFEAPRFKVDVAARAQQADGKRSLSAEIVGRYLFGAPMDKSPVSWQLRRTTAEPPRGPLADAGLTFTDERDEWVDVQEERWQQSGEGTLDEHGKLTITQPLALAGTSGPQRFVLEADVSDASYRHVAGRGEVVVHPSPRYAGVKGPRGWMAAGADFSVDLGVVDTDGQAVAGQTVTAKLMSSSWRYQERRGPNGAIHGEWKRDRREVDRCSATSANKPVTCQLSVPSSGGYDVVAEVDGAAGGSMGFWAWRDGDPQRVIAPGRGNAIQLVADKGRYAPGDTARVLVLNPYPEALAVVTTEAGRLVKQSSLRLKQSGGLVELPIEPGFTPHVHMTVTLLPIGAKGAAAASYRVGAVRLPVESKTAGLQVGVKSDRASYRPGHEAEVSVEVSENGRPVSSEVALAIVDEGVLRLTGFHAANPADSLWPATALDFVVRDSRSGLSELYQRSHIAGDGGGESSLPPDTRRNFVETALWRPLLRTDEKGRATVRFKLPDNLTEFRMMAVAIDASGKGGRDEASFTVNKPQMIEPVMPRFAHAGDRFELAAMVHNASDQPFRGVVRMEGSEQKIDLAAGSRERVAKSIEITSTATRSVRMELANESGEIVDRVERKLPASFAGVPMRPQLAGAFRGSQSISLEIPAEARFDENAELILQAGAQLWPELGSRLEYLLGYPHGCVEQTTSSTLPLIAAREILPRIGVDRHSDEFFRARITAGLQRLATMRTHSGGLGYWPGDPTPNVYGTAYAIRAVIGAKKAGIVAPEGMLEGMTRYLEAAVKSDSVHVVLRASIAQSLAELGALPPGIGEALFARRSEMSPFAKASLAIALSYDPKEKDRIKTLVGELESRVDDTGALDKASKEPVLDQHEHYGSTTRTLAQIAMAFGKTQSGSLKLSLVLRKLANDTGSYTTQATAFALLALADHVSRVSEQQTDMKASLDGAQLAFQRELKGGRELRIRLADLAGKKARLELSSGAPHAVAFVLRAAYDLPSERVTGGTSSDVGPDVYRMITTADGSPIDLAHVKAGQLVRVALLARFHTGGARRSYLAVNDALPAGFEPVEPDLASVASAPNISSAHPLHDLLAYSGSRANYVDMKDDRVSIYFDSFYGNDVAATYLARATTPGTFALPPASAELMYEANSHSFSDGGTVVIE